MQVLQTLGKIIPPPAYIQLPSVGVDVSDTSLKYVEFKSDHKSGTELMLKRWGDIDIPEGALSRGVVNDGGKLTEALREMKSRTGAENIRVSLPEERAYLFETKVERGASAKEIRGLLEFRLEENVPLSPRDAFFDYDLIEDEGPGGHLRVSVTAYAKDTVMSYYDACRAADLVPLSFEIEAQAIARATIPKGDAGTHMIIDFGKTRTGVGIVHQGVLMYTSTIDVGGGELSKAMREKLGDLPEATLTEIKNTQGLVEGKGEHDVHDILVKAMGTIVEEISTRITYWNTKDVAHEGRQVQSIILCGGSVNMKGLPSYLTQTLGVEARRANVWENAFSFENHVPEISRRYSFGYATAVGLALASFM
ncbi:MAG: type 4 fimbrial biosis protein PilM, type pilus assembly protein PilM [Candidatus Parcubacteria bacterium]|jgi:type IV pilus assembly protein PilM